MKRGCRQCGSHQIRCDEYNIDEDGGEVDAGSVDDSKMQGVRWSRVSYDESRRK